MIDWLFQHFEVIFWHSFAALVYSLAIYKVYYHSRDADKYWYKYLDALGRINELESENKEMKSALGVCVYPYSEDRITEDEQAAIKKVIDKFRGEA